MTTTEPTIAPVDLPEILVQRLPGAGCWDLYRPDGRRHSASPNLKLIAESVMHEVRSLGGRAVVRYDDQDSLTARAERKRLGQATVNAVFEGARYWARWSALHAAYEPCDRDAPDGLIMVVTSVDFKIHEDDHQGYYTHLNTAGVAFTRPMLPHEIVHLATADGEVPE